jgi:phosphatidylglycerophosphate synthase
MSFELVSALFLFAVIAAVILAYGVRVAFKGKAHFDRVDRQGGSLLLSKSMMEVGYWFFQPVARLLIFCRITANQISFASLIFGLLAGLCLAFGHFGSGAVFASISFVMDSLDGIVARLTGQASDAGEVLDAAIDRYVECFFLGGLAVYYRELPVLLVLALLALLGAFMVSYSTAKAESLHVDVPKGSMRRPERAFYLTLGAALSPITIPWLEFDRTYSIAIAHPMIVALCMVAVIANFSAIERFWVISKVIRQREKEVRLSSSATSESVDAIPVRQNHF